jgi:hypothetical protein
MMFEHVDWSTGEGVVKETSVANACVCLSVLVKIVLSCGLRANIFWEQRVEFLGQGEALIGVAKADD